MKTRLFVIALVCCAYSMSFSQKRVTYFISTIPVKFEEIVLGEKQQNNSQNSNSQPQVEPETLREDNTTSTSPKEDDSKVEEQNNPILISAKQSKNKYYMAYLFKTKTFDETKMAEFNEYFNYDEIRAYAERNKKSDLLVKSEGHDVFFEKFSK